jgi:hypothetical protein
MYKVYVYDESAAKLFDYKTSIIPVIGDVYANLSTHDCPGHYKVTRRILHTSTGFENVITIWVKKTSEALVYLEQLQG